MKLNSDATRSWNGGDTVGQGQIVKVGDWVVVRPAHEILATLDQKSCLQELPFMPQMLQHCGKSFRVRKRAHKMCDTVWGTGARHMTDAVFLDDSVCDGKKFGGCEMGCSIVWKEAWLRPLGGDDVAPLSVPEERQATERLAALADFACQRPGKAGGETVFMCQATKIPAATKPLPWWSLNQYVTDYKSGNVNLSTLLPRTFFMFYSQLVTSGLGFGSALRWLYNAVQSALGGVPFPLEKGYLRAGGPTPAVNLGLRVGELVRVKSREQILETVDTNLVNRGMGIHPVMLPYCGKTFRVKQRVYKLINEKNGQLVTLKNSCIILDGAGCDGRFTTPVNCPRALAPYWREIWLERVEEVATTPHSAAEEPKVSVNA